MFALECQSTNKMKLRYARMQNRASQKENCFETIFYSGFRFLSVFGSETTVRMEKVEKDQVQL